MHDLSLGPPVEVDRDPEATHPGPCFDGVYGCHRCWNSADGGKGTVFTCDWCNAKEVHTQVVRSIEEPVMYAICEGCQERQRRALFELEQELADYEDDRGYAEGDY